MTAIQNRRFDRVADCIVIRIDGRVLRVVFVNDRDEQPEYELENGSCIGNRDFSYDDVLLESEVR